MNPFRQTIIFSLVLVVIMVCGVATQSISMTTQLTNAATTVTARATQPTAAATTTTTRQQTTTLSKITVQSVQTGPTSTTGLTANLTYECYSNETIRLVGSDFVKSYNSLRIMLNKSNSSDNCKAAKQSDGGFLIEGKDCFNNLLRGSLTTGNNPGIVGGKSFAEFTFECDGLPRNGTIKTVTLKVSSQIASGTSLRPAITLQPQSPYLDLQFTVTDNMNKEKITFVDGDAETLHIKGPGAYYMYLQECIAFNGTSADSAFTKHTLYQDFMPADNTLIDKAKDGKQGEITIDVYAFHFVGSNDVTYQCTILICPDTTCRQKQTNTSGRKRRAASVRSEQVETSVKVLEKYDPYESTVSSAERTGAALFLLIASLTLLRPLF